MKKSMFMFAGLALAAVSASAQSTREARAAYQQQQALAEVPRLVQQFDLLVQNQDEIAARLVKLESADVTTDVRAEIAALKAEIGDLDRVKSCVKILVFVASADDFYDQPAVANGATKLLGELFGEEIGIPSRSAVGMNVLPGNLPVEIEAMFELCD